MNIRSFNKDLEFNSDRVQTKVIAETSFSKEIRILLKSGQLMKEHQTPFPILIHVLKGKIEFGVQGNKYDLIEGDIIALEGTVPHDLNAKEDSVVRLSLSKHDKVERVQKVIED